MTVEAYRKSSSYEPSKSFIIEIPLKSKKRVVSLRVDEDALAVIDKFVARKGMGSRTLLISKLVEALAEGLKQNPENIDKVALTLKIGSKDFTAFISLNS
ncbi:hypothetical protein IMZ38_05025 [Thermosphaera chiliense]|uniref:Uncharacterized protein n=1 Tax=Thermosphaera chiliense TaxID=3402707 RepID=A0A7M1UR55_9CREN|nr:hypothetical protein [Thermosphaera aggregans]QOR94007.1 hypothetical protein IMZ38_05025 [Thermosphaera aggregans]